MCCKLHTQSEFHGQDTSNFIIDTKVREKMGIPGEEVLKPQKILKTYKVFVQSRGTGARHLDKDSAVLYKVFQFCDVDILSS